MNNITVLMIPLEDHAADIQQFRYRHVHDAGAELPPHVSVIYPFLPADEIPDEDATRLASICAAHLPFAYEFGSTGRFAAARVLFLEPAPDTPFHALFRAIWRAFPALQPTFPDPVMHLTIAQDDPGTSLAELDREFGAEFAGRLPIRTEARSLDLFEKRDGTWRFVRQWPAGRHQP